jgi:ribonuclease HI
MKYLFQADGGSRGNPGPAASGAVLFKKHGLDWREIDTATKYLGRQTNNVAEYTAIIIGLEMAQKHGVTELRVELDSELAVRQLTGVYKIKQPHLRELAEEVWALVEEFEEVDFHHIRREKNTRADELVNQTLDAQ